MKRMVNCGSCEQLHVWLEPCKYMAVGTRSKRRCQLPYGSCALNKGHGGRHNAYVGPWAGTSDGIDFDDDM